MKSKGFTLIELIALLGIIAIIILLGAPSLINQIETTRNNNYNNFVNDLCLASELYINHNDNIDGIDNFKVAGDSITINVSDLISSGYVKSSTKNPNTDQVLNPGDIITVRINNDMTYSCTLNS